MDIIKAYLDNMFASLPNTKEVNKMKEDLLINMEDKYTELKKSGKSENEAIGIVISEFGNIEELAKELNIDITINEETDEIISIETAKDFMDTAKKNGKLVAIGVFLCILSPVLLILLSKEQIANYLNLESGTLFGFIYLFISVAIAVGLFIYAGMNFSKYEYLKKETNIPVSVKQMVKIEKEKFDPKFTLRLVISVMLFILSPLLIIMFGVINDSLEFEKYNTIFGVVFLLVLVAIGCLIIIQAGLIKDSHNVLLQIGEYSKKQVQENRVVGAIGAIFWPLITIAYLFWSFVYDAWHISWIIWVISGIIFGGISAAIQILDNNNKEKA